MCLGVMSSFNDGDLNATKPSGLKSKIHTLLLLSNLSFLPLLAAVSYQQNQFSYGQKAPVALFILHLSTPCY